MIVRQIIAEGLVINNIGSSDADRDEMVRIALKDVQMDPDVMDRFPMNFQEVNANESQLPERW